MGSCVSKQTTFLRVDTWGCLTERTYIEPTREQIKQAKAEDKAVRTALRRAGVRDIVPEARETFQSFQYTTP